MNYTIKLVAILFSLFIGLNTIEAQQAHKKKQVKKHIPEYVPMVINNPFIKNESSSAQVYFEILKVVLNKTNTVIFFKVIPKIEGYMWLTEPNDPLGWKLVSNNEKYEIISHDFPGTCEKNKVSISPNVPMSFSATFKALPTTTNEFNVISGKGVFDIYGVNISEKTLLNETASQTKNKVKTDNLDMSLLKVTPDRKDNKWGLLDDKGNIVVPYIYDHIFGFDDYSGLGVVELNGKKGYIDKKGNIIIQLIYDDARGFNEGLSAVKLNDKWGYINKIGKFEITPQFDDARNFVNGIAAVCCDCNNGWDAIIYAFINKKGEKITPCKFRQTPIKGGLYLGKIETKDGFKYYRIFENGRIVEADKNGQIFSNSVAFESNKDYPVYSVFSFTATSEIDKRLGFKPTAFEFEIIDKTERKYQIKVKKGSGHFYIHDGKKEEFMEVKEGYEFWWVKWHFNNEMEKKYDPTVYIP